eukprot:5656282-Pyramimonas_sp.AAC.1
MSAVVVWRFGRAHPYSAWPVNSLHRCLVGCSVTCPLAHTFQRGLGSWPGQGPEEARARLGPHCHG